MSSSIEMPSAAECLSYENCVLHSLFRQTSFYINRTFVSASNNLSNYASYLHFRLMTPMAYKLLRCMAIGYGYKRTLTPPIYIEMRQLKIRTWIGK